MSIQEPIAYTPDGQPVFPSETTADGERRPLGVLADGRPVRVPLEADDPAPPLDRVPRQGFRTGRGNPPAALPAEEAWPAGTGHTDRRRLLVPAIVVAGLTVLAVIWGLSTADDAATPVRSNVPVTSVVDLPLRTIGGGTTAGP